jgi:hypothetical protein
VDPAQLSVADPAAAAVTSEVVVSFVVLPDPATGSNDTPSGQGVASALVRELAQPGVSLCAAECRPCANRTRGGCCALAPPPSPPQDGAPLLTAQACARAGLDSTSSLVQSPESEAALAAALEQEVGVLRVTVTLGAADLGAITATKASRAAFERAFAADVAALLRIDASRVRVTSLAAGSVVVTFVVLPDAAGVPFAPPVLEAALGGGGGGGVTLGGFSATQLAYPGRPAASPPSSEAESSSSGALVAVLLLLALAAVGGGGALLMMRRRRRQMQSGTPYKVGTGMHKSRGAAAVVVPDMSAFEEDDGELTAQYLAEAAAAAAAAEEEAAAPNDASTAMPSSSSAVEDADGRVAAYTAAPPRPQPSTEAEQPPPPQPGAAESAPRRLRPIGAAYMYDDDGTEDPEAQRAQALVRDLELAAPPARKTDL